MKTRVLAGVGLAMAGVTVAAASAAYLGANGQVAFDDGSVFPSRIGVVNPDGSGEQTLSQRGDHSPRYSPDGKKIVFFSTRDLPGPADGIDDDDAEIFSMNADGSNQTQLTANEVRDEVPAWTPDGRIVFTRRAGLGRWDLWIMDANGANQRQLTDLGGVAAWPTPEPDGGRLAFASDHLGAFHVFTMRLDGTQLRQVTPSNTVDWAPEWSPRGDDIVFTRETPAPGTAAGVDEDVYVVHASGALLRQLTSDPARADLFPSWSPDGRFVIFSASFDWMGPNWHGNLIAHGVKTGSEFAVGRPDIGGYPAWQPLR